MFGFLAPVLKIGGSLLGKLFGGGIIGDLLGGIKDHVKGERELKAARQNTELQIELVRAQSIAKQDTAEIDLNKIRVEQAGGTWKDEFWTIIFGGMFVSAFFFPDRLQEGLTVLGSMDNDMKGMMAVVIGSAFGVSLWKKVRK